MQWASWFVLFASGTTMNGKKYLKLLKHELKNYTDIHQCKIFMHGGAPCQRSRILCDFLKTRKRKFCNGLETVPTLAL